MILGERLVHWAIVIGFALLALVMGVAAVLVYLTGQPGNILLLDALALSSGAVAYVLRAKIKKLSR
jgi:hypothetical protein